MLSVGILLMKNFSSLAAAMLLFVTSVPVLAAVVQTDGAGSAVLSVDRTATFDSLTSNGIDLTGYSEDNIDIFAPGTTYQDFDAFDGGPTTAFHYESGGNNEYNTIKATDGASIYALEFMIGHGQNSYPDANVVWETWRSGGLTGSGTFTIARGSIVGWCDTEGFDELRVGAVGIEYVAFGTHQSIALDDLGVQTQLPVVCGDVSYQPVPTLNQWSLILLTLLVLVIAFVGFRRFA